MRGKRARQLRKASLEYIHTKGMDQQRGFWSRGYRRDVDGAILAPIPRQVYQQFKRNWVRRDRGLKAVG